MRKISAMLLCMLLCLMTVTACGQKPEQEPAQTNPPVQTEALLETAPAVTQTEPAQTEPRYDVVVVSTLYGDVCYQEQWSEHMIVDMQAGDGLLTVNFLAEFNGLKYPLFDLIIGVSEDEAITQMTGPDGTRRGVAVNYLELGEHPELAEDQRNQLFAMQEDVNFVIDSIQ